MKKHFASLTCALVSLVFAEVGHHLTRLTSITCICPGVDVEGQHRFPHLYLVAVG